MIVHAWPTDARTWLISAHFGQKRRAMGPSGRHGFVAALAAAGYFWKKTPEKTVDPVAPDALTVDAS